MRHAALLGFHGAVSRFDRAAGAVDQHRAFIAASEALWWALTLDERFRQYEWYRSLREGDQDGAVLQGMAYARNRTTHALPMTIRAADVYSDTYQDSFLVIVWRDLEDLPEPAPEHRQGRRQYAALLAGREVARSLHSAALWFAKLQNDVRAGFGQPMFSTRPPWDDGRGPTDAD